MGKFKCAMCGEEHEREWTEEEKLEEMRQNFGEIPEDERVVICDDCYVFVLGFETFQPNTQIVMGGEG